MRAAAPLLFAAAAQADVWQPVRDAIDGFRAISNMAVSVGNASGTVFVHEKGTTTMDTEMGIASATKWISGVTVMKAVEDGHLGLDDFVHQHLPFWTKDPADIRSRITLRHCLSFKDGYKSEGNIGDCSKLGLEFMDCVEHMYNTTTHTGNEPGTWFNYNSMHLQISGAMAQAATGVPIADMIDAAVFKPAGMTHTTWRNRENPQLSAGITTSATDYGSFLQLYTTGRLVSQDTRAEMEKDQFPNATYPLVGAPTFVGHYGLANWFECMMNAGVWRAECYEQDAHSSMGARGYWPLDVRREKYFLQIATTEGPQNSALLRIQIKPLVDAIITGKEVPAIPEIDMEATTAQLKAGFDELFRGFDA